MNKFLTCFFISVFSQAQGSIVREIGPAAFLFGRNWMFVDNIASATKKAKKIDQEIEKKRFLLKPKAESYVENIRDRYNRIQELQSEILRSRLYVSATNKADLEELELELAQLLNKPIRIELNEKKPTDLDKSIELGLKVLPPPSRENFEKPIVWIAPTESEGSQTPQTPTVLESSESSSVPDQQTPLEFFCPITHRIMQNPVVARDGYTYEKKAIERWFSANNFNEVRSPMTNEFLQGLELTDNLNLKKIIRDTIEKNRTYQSLQTSSVLNAAGMCLNQATQVSPSTSSAFSPEIRAPEVRAPERSIAVSVGVQTSSSREPVEKRERTFLSKAIKNVQPINGLAEWPVPSLEWELNRRNSPPMNFEQAIRYCVQKRDGWRLPTIWELYSLSYQESLESDFSVGFYWSSTVTMDTRDSQLFAIHFPDGVIFPTSQAADLQVRCVRIPVERQFVVQTFVQRVVQTVVRTVAADTINVHRTLPTQSVPALEWELGRKGSEVMTFTEAQDYVDKRKKDGWRLPSIWELFALYQQRLVLGDDFDTGWFWSNTVDTNNDFCWFVHFRVGSVFNDNIQNSHQVRLVRSLNLPKT